MLGEGRIFIWSGGEGVGGLGLPSERSSMKVWSNVTLR